MIGTYADEIKRYAAEFCAAQVEYERREKNLAAAKADLESQLVVLREARAKVADTVGRNISRRAIQVGAQVVIVEYKADGSCVSIEELL